MTDDDGSASAAFFVLVPAFLDRLDGVALKPHRGLFAGRKLDDFDAGGTKIDAEEWSRSACEERLKAKSHRTTVEEGKNP